MYHEQISKSPVVSSAGFTLLELLVTVLIIGILSSVAVPQYRKVAIKARAALAQVNLKALTDAQERYWLSNRTYTNDLEQLDVDVEEDAYYSYLCIEERTCFASPKDVSIYPLLEFHLRHGENPDLLGKHWCISVNAYPRTKNICSAMGRGIVDQTVSTAEHSYFVIN